MFRKRVAVAICGPNSFIGERIRYGCPSASFPQSEGERRPQCPFGERGYDFLEAAGLQKTENRWTYSCFRSHFAPELA